MRQFFTALVIVGILIFLLVLAAPALPEGNPIRDIGESVRAVGRGMADGFGGGYGWGPSR